MELMADDDRMVEGILLIGVLAICVLAAFFGVDSRFDESDTRRRNLV